MSIRQTISERPWILAVAVAAAVAGWIATGYIGREPVAVSTASTSAGLKPAAVAARVQVETLAAQPVTRYISVYGRSAPARQVELKSETDGRVLEINARRGEQIKRGTPILSLDMRDREARLGQAKASVAEHRTAYEAQMKLKADGYISDTQITETVARLEAARAELKRAELDLEYRVLRAPFNGVILEREVEVGDYVRAGDEVVSFVDNTRLIVTGTIAEQDARFVSTGTTANAVLVTGEQVTGRIRYVAPVADQATRTFTVELEIPNPDGKLPAGVTAEMRIPGGEMLAQKISPSLLTLDSDGNIGLKTIDQYNRVVFHEVDIARTDPDGVWVSGLPETANVITIGQGYVAAGDEVDAVFADPDTTVAAELP